MKQLKITSWLKPNTRMLLRNLLCLLNVILWLYVLYFSMHEDEKAAVLSYLSVMLTVILLKYDIINRNQASIIDIMSKALILVGFSFALFRFWNIAFYSICLGIMAQKMKWVLESVLINVYSSGNVEEISEDSKINTSGSSKNKQAGNFHLQNVGQKKANNLLELNKSEKLGSTEQTISKEPNETFREFPSSKKIGNFIDIKNFNFSNKEKLHPCNEKHVKENCTECSKQSTLKQKDFLKPKIDSYNDVIENKILTIVSSRDLKSQIVNMNDLGLKEFSETGPDCKSDNTIRERELKNKEINDDTSEKLIAITDEMLRLSEIYKKMDSIINTTEYQNELENSSKTVFPPVQVNTSEVLDIESSSSNSDKKSLHEEIKNKFSLTTVHDLKDKTSLNSDFSDLDTVLQYKQSSERVKNAAVIQREEDLLNKSDFQSETLITGTIANSRNELETMNCMTENITIQPEAVCEYQMEYISEPNNDENLKTVLKNHDIGSFLKYEDPVSEILQNSCTVSQHEKSLSIDKKPVSNFEDQNKTKEFSIDTSENEFLTDKNKVSIVEDVVNRIDLGFIYALGYNNLKS